MYLEKRVLDSERLQILLLDNLYALKGTEAIIFQGGTALRWVYGGNRFSEDLDFVTSLSHQAIKEILKKLMVKMEVACLAQFGPGRSEMRDKSKRESAVKVFYIFRPDSQRERIAVKIEFEALSPGKNPEYEHFVLTDLKGVHSLVTSGNLVLPYSSTILPVQTTREIYSDKIRAIYERKYLKGRDFYDLWWLSTYMNITLCWENIQKKFQMYQFPFTPARKIAFFKTDMGIKAVCDAVTSDLPRFIPQPIFDQYKKNGFENILSLLKEIVSDLMQQGKGNSWE